MQLQKELEGACSIVVADTSPLNYLVLRDQVEILVKLHFSVIIPPAVANELGRADAPTKVRTWIQSHPSWLVIKAPGTSDDGRLARLDPGEKEALTLALKLQADLVLADDRDVRVVAPAQV